MPRIGVGTEFLYGSRNLKIDRRKEGDAETFIVIDQDYDTKEEWTYKFILAEYADKKVTFKRKWDKKSSKKEIKLLQDLPKKEQDIIKFRYYCAKPLVNVEGKDLKSDVEERLFKLQEEFENTDKRICLTNLYNWRKLLRDNDGDILSLGTQYSRGKGTGKKRTQREVLDIINDIIQKHFLNKRGVSAATVCRLVHAAINRVNQDIENNEHLKKPDNSTIYRIINQIDSFEKAKAKYGYLEAYTKHGYVGETEKPTRPMQFVQADHSPLDVILVDDKTRKRLPRAYLTALIDVYTGYVVGFHISFRKPNYNSVMLALLNAYTPNKNMKEKYPELINDWLSYGLPEVLFVDNGKEFHSNALKNACLELGIELVYCKVKQPWHKPYVENFFLTKNDQFDHMLFGTTHANNQEVKKRDKYNPANEACIGFEKYLKLFYKWLLDAYNNRVLDRISDTPMDFWITGTKINQPRLYSSMEKLKIILLPSELRKVGRGVIKMNRLRFRSPELWELSRHISTHCPNKKVEVKWDPDDVSHIYVRDFINDCYTEVLCDNPRMLKGINTYIYKLMKSKTLNEKRKMTEDVIAETFLTILEEVEEEKANHKAISSELANRMDLNSANSEDKTEVVATKVVTMKQEMYATASGNEFEHGDAYYED